MIRLFKGDILHFLKSLTEFEVKNIDNYSGFPQIACPQIACFEIFGQMPQIIG